MIRTAEIQNRLLHLIGWQQSYDTQRLKIAESLTESESGLYFQQIHPLLTLENMHCIAPDFENITHVPFDLTTYYKKGAVVKFNGKLYRCLKDNLVGYSPDGEYSPTNLLEPYNPSFEDDFDHWNRESPYDHYSIVSSDYDGKKAVLIGITGGGGASNLNLSIYKNAAGNVSGTAPNLIFVEGHVYRFQFAAKKHRDTDIQETASYYIDVTSSIIRGGYNLKSTDWVVVSRDITAGKNFVLHRLFVSVLNTCAVVFDAISLKDVTFEQATDPAEYWEEIDLFSEWLEQKTKASIQKAISRFCTEKLSQGTYKALCENRTLFDGTGRIVDTVKNRGRLVGFEIVPIRSKGVTTKINKIGLQFTEPGLYTLYLMHSSSHEPVKIIELNKTKKNSMEWFTIEDLYLPYQGEGNDAGGSWYLCYFQSELPEGSQAIRKERDWSKGPCKSCSRQEFVAWQAWSKYLEIHPFYVDGELVNHGGINSLLIAGARDYLVQCLGMASDNNLSFNDAINIVNSLKAVDFDGQNYSEITFDIVQRINPKYTWDSFIDYLDLYISNNPNQHITYIVQQNEGFSLWDVENNQYTYDTNYGINLEITVGCDITDFIIEQRFLFQDIIAKQVAADMLREFAYNANVRTNRHSINASRLDILYEVDGDSSSMKKSGLSYQLDMAFKAIELSTLGIDRVCLPCKNNGIKYRTI